MLDLIDHYNHVILFCGNDDLEQQPFKEDLKAETPEDVTSFLNFKTILRGRNTHTHLHIIGQIPRPDVERELATNKQFTRTNSSSASIVLETMSLTDISWKTMYT